MRVTLLSKMALGILLVSACSVVLTGQEPAPSPPPFDQLKDVLQLSDQQVRELARLRRERIEDLRQLRDVQGTQEKRRLLRQLLQQEPLPEASVVGELVLAIEIDEQRIRQRDARYANALRNVLTDEQKTMLRRLRQALQLQPAARQAVAWGLLDAPSTP